MSANTAVAVLGAFVLLDLLKFWISETMGTGAVWLLQQDVRALRRSVATATTPRSLATRAARERLLRDKERALLRRQTPALRRALFYTHYLSVAKGIFGAACAVAMWGEPLFRVQRESVWPLGRWLAVPHGKEWEAGAVAILPWLALSAAASVAATEGIVGPATKAAARALGRHPAPIEDEHRDDDENDAGAEVSPTKKRR